MIRIASAALAATIAEEGAELQTLTDAQGRDWLWDGDPAYWTGRAPLLFPIVGALNGDRYRLDGRDYTLAKHGFARRSRFGVVETGASTATLRLAADDTSRAAYPFDFTLDMRYAIEGNTLVQVATVANRDIRPMPASFGFHPALRWPLPGAGDRADHLVRFDQPEPAPIRRIDAAGLLRHDPLPTPVQGRDLPLADDLFEDDALIFDQLESRGLWFGVPGQPGLRADFAGMPHLGLWTKLGAGYLCIEPWQGYADPVGFARELTDRPGVVILSPGEARDFTMRITLGALG